MGEELYLSFEGLPPGKSRCPRCSTLHDIALSRVKMPKSTGAKAALEEFLSEIGREQVRLKCPKCGTTYETQTSAEPNRCKPPTLYFECTRPSRDGRCSDDSCPCGYPGANIPRGSGYLYVSKELVEMRRGALSLAAIQEKAQSMQEHIGAAMMMATSGVFMPILMCELGAKRRGIDLGVAAADAKHWWETGLARLRPTPMAVQTSTSTRAATSLSVVAGLATTIDALILEILRSLLIPAVQRSTDKSTLQDIAENEKDAFVRRAARERLAAISRATGPADDRPATEALADVELVEEDIVQVGLVEIVEIEEDIIMEEHIKNLVDKFRDTQDYNEAISAFRAIATWGRDAEGAIPVIIEKLHESDTFSLLRTGFAINLKDFVKGCGPSGATLATCCISRHLTDVEHSNHSLSMALVSDIEGLINDVGVEKQKVLPALKEVAKSFRRSLSNPQWVDQRIEYTFAKASPEYGVEAPKGQQRAKLRESLLGLLHSLEQTLLDIISKVENDEIGVVKPSIGTREEKGIPCRKCGAKIPLSSQNIGKGLCPHCSPKGCFIATATMGSYDHPAVLVLRRLRDEYLQKRKWGRSLIDLYYKYSPFFASLIGRHSWLKWISYIAVIRPMVAASKIVLHRCTERHEAAADPRGCDRGEL